MQSCAHSKEVCAGRVLLEGSLDLTQALVRLAQDVQAGYALKTWHQTGWVEGTETLELLQGQVRHALPEESLSVEVESQ